MTVKDALHLAHQAIRAGDLEAGLEALADVFEMLAPGDVTPKVMAREEIENALASIDDDEPAILGLMVARAVAFTVVAKAASKGTKENRQWAAAIRRERREARS